MWAIFQLQDLLGMDATLRRKNPHDERINRTINFHYIEISERVTLPQGNNAIRITLAPETRIEIFSLNLKDVLKQGFNRSNPVTPEDDFVVEHFKLNPGIYEFTWSVGFDYASKPLFFKIR